MDTNTGPWSMDMVVQLAIITLPLLIVVIVMHYRYRRILSLHRTVRELCAKGLAVPKELLDPPRRPDNPVMTALILIGLGGGLGVFYLARGDSGVTGNWGIGAIPFFMGIAQLLAVWLQRRVFKRGREGDEESG